MFNLFPEQAKQIFSGTNFIREEISGDKGNDNSDNTCIPNKWNKYNLLPHEPKEALTHRLKQKQAKEFVS